MRGRVNAAHPTVAQGGPSASSGSRAETRDERSRTAEAEQVEGRGDIAPLVRAYLSIVAATLFWSSNVVAVKFLLREVPAFPAALLRITMAAATLLAWHLASGKRLLIRRAAIRDVLPLGTGGIFLSFLFFTLALSNTSVAHAVFIGALVPTAVLLLARWEGQERVTALKLTGLLVSLVGVVLLALDKTNGGGSSWKGDLLAAAGLWCFAFYTVRSKRLAPLYDSLTLNTYAFAVAALCCLPVLFWEAPRIPWRQITWVGWSGLLYSATVGSAAAYLAYYFSLRILTASQVAAFHYVQPVLATLLGVLLLQESWGAKFGAGAALILAGVFLAERR